MRPPTMLERPSIFLAGGIVGCPDWQSETEEQLSGSYKVYNPRQTEFDFSKKDAAREQIQWEYRFLNKADAIMFWFCEETIQPIVMFELGRWSYVQKTIFVGSDPNYTRRTDVVEQLWLARPNLRVHNDLQELTDHVLRSRPWSTFVQ